jgi:hypothetical protein
MNEEQYRVLLLYPDHMAVQYGDTYLSDPIHTDTPEEAVIKAKTDCCDSNSFPIEDRPDFDDFVVLLVVKGGEII